MITGNHLMENTYDKGSLSLLSSIAMGTGVMIGAGIFALTGQVASFAGPMFPLAFLLAGVISGFSAYTYIRVSNKYPSAGGIAMILRKAYGPTAITGTASLLMAFSMIINESLVARTFGSYMMQVLPLENQSLWVPVFAIGLIFFAFLVNISNNKIIGNLSKVTAVLKIGGILAFAGAALWASGFSFQAATSSAGQSTAMTGFLAGVALAILAYKGFTTITNSGGEIENPTKNVGRSIMASLAICVVVYMFVAFAVGSSLSIEEIAQAQDYSLAEAARPALGQKGVLFTVLIAIIATASGILASVFAVSRMLTMLTDMELIPHRHFGMPGPVQKHLVVYTVVLAAVLAAFFDLGRIASLGAIFYLVMDIAIHWGVFRHLRDDVAARGWILISAIVLDAIVLVAFLIIKGSADPLILLIAFVSITAVFVAEWTFVKNKSINSAPGHDPTDPDKHG